MEVDKGSCRHSLTGVMAESSRESEKVIDKRGQRAYTASEIWVSPYRQQSRTYPFAQSHLRGRTQLSAADTHNGKEKR